MGRWGSNASSGVGIGIGAAHHFPQQPCGYIVRHQLARGTHGAKLTRTRASNTKLSRCCSITCCCNAGRRRTVVLLTYRTVVLRTIRTVVRTTHDFYLGPGASPDPVHRDGAGASASASGSRAGGGGNIDRLLLLQFALAYFLLDAQQILRHRSAPPDTAVVLCLAASPACTSRANAALALPVSLFLALAVSLLGAPAQVSA